MLVVKSGTLMVDWNLFDDSKVKGDLYKTWSITQSIVFSRGVSN